MDYDALLLAVAEAQQRAVVADERYALAAAEQKVARAELQKAWTELREKQDDQVRAVMKQYLTNQGK